MGAERTPKPRRIQLQRTGGWRKPENAVVVSRPSRWGNPFVIGKVSELTGGLITEANCLPTFERYCYTRLQLEADWLAPLRGKTLACWCKEGSPCHADILLRLANT